MVPSNFRLVVESRGREHFDAAMKMCFDAFDKAIGYRIDKDGFHLFWHMPDNVATADGQILALPYKMPCKAVSDFVWGWLQEVDRGSEPDLDGSCKADGFVVEHVPFGWGYEFIRVQAVWSEYHK
jgi:hypothetical protein